MITPYERYCSLMRERGLEPSMTEPQLLEAWGIKEDEVKPLSITPKRDARKVSASLDSHIKISLDAKTKRKKNLWQLSSRNLKKKRKKKLKHARSTIGHGMKYDVLNVSRR